MNKRHVKVIKIKLNGTDWLDPSTVKVMFTINNVTTDMNFLSGVHPFVVVNVFNDLPITDHSQSPEETVDS